MTMATYIHLLCTTLKVQKDIPWCSHMREGTMQDRHGLILSLTLKELPSGNGFLRKGDKLSDQLSTLDQRETSHLAITTTAIVELKQIDAFVQGIQCATTQSIVVNLAGNQGACTTFDDYYNALVSRLELAMILAGKTSNSATRNVNQVSKITNNTKIRRIIPSLVQILINKHNVDSRQRHVNTLQTNGKH